MTIPDEKALSDELLIKSILLLSRTVKPVSCELAIVKFMTWT